MAEKSLSTQSHAVQLVDAVPSRLQLRIGRPHVSPQLVRTEPQVVKLQKDPKTKVSRW